MCKLLVAFQINAGKEYELFNAINAQEDTMRTQTHGAGVLTVDKENAIGVVREVSDYDKVFATSSAMQDIVNKKMIAYHTRLASTGSVKKENVHFFDIDGRYFMAHNGMAYLKREYGGYSSGGSLGAYERGLGWQSLGWEKEKEKEPEPEPEAPTLKTEFVNGQSVYSMMNNKQEWEKISGKRYKKISRRYHENKQKENDTTDTMQFLESLDKPITEDGLRQHIKDSDFSGVAIIYDAVDNIAWIFSTRKITALTDGKNYLVLCSWSEIHRKFIGYKNILGFRLPDESKGFEIAEYDIPAGITKVNLNDIKL